MWCRSTSTTPIAAAGREAFRLQPPVRRRVTECPIGAAARIRLPLLPPDDPATLALVSVPLPRAAPPARGMRRTVGEARTEAIPADPVLHRWPRQARSEHRRSGQPPRARSGRGCGRKDPIYPLPLSGVPRQGRPYTRFRVRLCAHPSEPVDPPLPSPACRALHPRLQSGDDRSPSGARLRDRCSGRGRRPKAAATRRGQGMLAQGRSPARSVRDSCRGRPYENGRRNRRPLSHVPETARAYFGASTISIWRPSMRG